VSRLQGNKTANRRSMEQNAPAVRRALSGNGRCLYWQYVRSFHTNVYVARALGALHAHGGATHIELAASL
jgi:hypothetical protein